MTKEIGGSGEQTIDELTMKEAQEREDALLARLDSIEKIGDMSKTSQKLFMGAEELRTQADK